MDASVAAAIIGSLSAAVVGGLGFILTGLRAAVRANGEDIKANGERIGGLAAAFGRFEERTISEFGHVKDVLARIEATQEDHGRLLETHSHQLADHGRLLEKLAGDGAS